MTRKFTFLLMALLALAGFKSWGQNTLTVCDGMDFHNQVPIYTGYFDEVGTTSQFIIPSTEIVGLQGGSITKLEFYIAGSPYFSSFDYAGLKCSLKEVSSEVINGIVTSGLSTVYEGLLTYTATTMSVTFTTPFAYTGGHLLVSFEVTTESGYNECNFYGTNTSYVSSYCNQWVNTPISFIPKTTITYTGGSSCIAPTGLAASNITATGATISWTGNGAESYDLAYGLASTFDLSNPATYTPQSGLTATSVQLSGLTAETEYKCAVRSHCDAEDVSAWSSAVAFLPTAKMTLTVNEGNTYNDRVPFQGYNADGLTKSQFIIPAATLTAMEGADITALDFYTTTSGSNVGPADHTFYGSWDVYFKIVDYVIMPFSYESSDGMDKVYTGNMVISNSKMTLTFAEPYTYEGGNLMIYFNQTQSTGYKSTYWRGVATSEYAARAGYTGSYGSDNANYYFLPTTTFTYEQSGPRYTVTVNQLEEGGTISADPMANVAPETAVTLSATPSFGYEFGQWTVVDEGGNPVTLNGEATAATNGFSMPESNVTVSATFNTLEMYAITFDQSIIWTEMSANHESAPAGTTIELFYTPDEAYIFNYWTVNGVQIEGNTFEMPAEAVEVSMNYTVRSRYSVNIGDLENGTITANPSENILGGTEVTLTIEPATGYTLNELTVTEATSGDAVTVTGNKFFMPEDNVNVTATFSTVYYVQIDPSLVGGTITHMSTTPGETAYAAGTYVYFIPNESEDYEYVDQSFVVTTLEHHPGEEPEWVEVTVNVDYSGGLAHIVMPAGNVTVTATFNKVKFAVTQQNVNPMGSGSYSVSPTSHVAGNTSVYISNINPSDDYQFASVSVTRNDNQAAVETYPYYGDYLFYMPDSDVTVTVNFEEKPYYNVTVGTVTNGTVSVEDATSFWAGVTVWLNVQPLSGDYILESITATPEEGDPITPTHNYSNYYTFTMPSSNVTISVTFRLLQSYTINYYVNGELDRTMQCKEDRFVNNDGPQNVAVPAGMTFEGWGVAEIDPYTTEKPAVLGNAEYPTQDYDLYAVLSYTEEIPAAKGGETWKKVESTSELSDGDEIVLVYGNYVMGGLWGTDYHMYEVSIADNEISNLPSNANILTLAAFGSNWKLQYYESEISSTTTLSYNTGSFLGYYGQWESWGYSTYDEWTAVESSGVMFLNSDFNYYIGKYQYGDYISVTNSSTACKAYKKDNPFITTNYYMTSVLADGEVAANTTAKNIVITTGIVTVDNNIVLTMNGNGLFRNKNAANFVFEDGAQLIYDGDETVNATMKKNINCNASKASNVNWYTISSPLAASVNVTDVTNLIPTTVTATDYDLYRLDEKNGMWINSRIYDTDGTTIIENDNFKTIDKGVGYIYSNQAKTTVAFAGEINVADVECTLTNSKTNGFNLIGNPFSQNITLDNVESDGTAELADGFYVLTCENTWGTEITAGTIAPLQGFLVQATTAGDVTISKPTSGSKGERSKEQSTSIEMIVSNSNHRDNAYAMFGEGIGLNKINHRNAEAPMLYIPQSGEDFAIAFMNENTTLFPLNFKAMTTGKYSISLKATDDINTLVLVDNMTGVETNMLLESSYSFIGSPRDNENRFTVKFEVSDNTNLDNDDNFVYQYGNELIIDGEGTLQMFDVLGRVVISEEVHGQRVDVSNLTKGAYIVRMTGENVRTQKIIVK